MTITGRRISARQISGAALPVVVVAAAYLAVHLHRRGHTTGDDFALYLRQAKSLFDGNMAQVVSDNIFLAHNSVGVTPGMYPWGYPLLLSPLVRVFGLDYGRLKLVDVAALCVWLVLFHGIVRRRAGRIVALALTAMFATAPVYLIHTDQLLTELPHMAATALVIWWLDRVATRHRLTDVATRDLVVLGLLMVLAYNIRREGIVLVAVVLSAQLVDVVAARDRSIPWRRLAVPHVSFAAGAVLAQLLLPATLIPDNDNSRHYITTRLFTDYPGELTTQLGLAAHPLLGRILLAVALAGMVLTCLTAPRRHVPLAVLTVGTMLLIGTHFRMVARYYYQVTPWLAFFALTIGVTAVRAVTTRLHASTWVVRTLLVVATFPALYVTTINVWILPSRLDAAARYNASGAIQSGPTNPRNFPVYDAIIRNTRADDVILYYRARTLMLYTDRQAFQTTSVNNLWKADYFMQSLKNDYSQPRISEHDLVDRGWVEVWEDPNWRLWRAPPPEPPSGLRSPVEQDPRGPPGTDTSVDGGPVGRFP